MGSKDVPGVGRAGTALRCRGTHQKGRTLLIRQSQLFRNKPLAISNPKCKVDVFADSHGKAPQIKSFRADERQKELLKRRRLRLCGNKGIHVACGPMGLAGTEQD